LSIPALPAGLYKLVVSGTHNYSSISQTADILVPASQLTINDLFATSGLIIGVASAASGLISAFAVYFVNRLRMRNLGNAMTRIANEYKKYKKTTDQADKYKYIDRFENMREEFLEILQKGKIDENKYQMLDEKISEYVKVIYDDLAKISQKNPPNTRMRRSPI
jgi:uncharacterized membrane protein (DUF106 family)